ncbi:urokinase plasminogen activator surface receptor-like, partial [Zonotrichia albicollis]|uniref:urokinase plasminogen activator surface receptor-like n=1 Tax=Zonotrichia albicollis TaxID=44394 RepID=UPI003D811245
MGWGRGLVVLWGLLGTAVPALRCPLCDVTGCRPALCPSPRAACRRTTLTSLRDGLEFRREESGCDVTGPPDVVITFRSRGEIVTLREERWGAGPEGGHAPEPAPTPPTNGSGPAPLLCPTCDGFCPAPLPALPCPRPQDRCIDVISRGPNGEGEGHRLRGCGQAGPCRGLLAFDSGRGRRGALTCCETGECEPEPGPPSGLSCWGYDGPAPSAGHAPSEGPAPLRCGWGRGRCFTAWGRGSWSLRCLRCHGDADADHDGGSCGDVTAVSCPDSDVCGEALAAVTWSHGQLTLGWRGCGRGQPGSLARALTLPGLVAFERRRNCRGQMCNGELPLGAKQLPPGGAKPGTGTAPDRYGALGGTGVYWVILGGAAGGRRAMGNCPWGQNNCPGGAKHGTGTAPDRRGKTRNRNCPRGNRNCPRQ